MSNSLQILTRAGSISAANAPFGRRIRIDPGLQDENGQPLPISDLKVIGPAKLVQAEPVTDMDGNILYAFFDIQITAPNPGTEAQTVYWKAKHNHSIQQNTSLQPSFADFGPNGVNPSPQNPRSVENPANISLSSGDFTASQVQNQNVIYGDSTGGSYTSNLPASPVHGDLFFAKNRGTANVWTLGRNGKLINGAAADINLAPLGSIALHYTDDHQWQEFA